MEFRETWERVAALAGESFTTDRGDASGTGWWSPSEERYRPDLLALVDPDQPWIVDSDKMAAAAGNTPFDKQPVQGRVLALYKGGAQVA